MTYRRFGRLPLEHFVSVYDSDYEAAGFTVVKVEEFEARLPQVWGDLDLALPHPGRVPFVNRRIKQPPVDDERPEGPGDVAW